MTPPALASNLDFPKQVAQMFIRAIDEGTKQGYRMIWSAIKQILAAHWLSISIFLVVLLLAAVLEYRITGRWAMLGSVLYHYFYVGALLLIVIIFGPEVFANTYFDIVLAVLYITCFSLVGLCLKKITRRGSR